MVRNKRIPVHLYQSGDWKREKHVPIIEAPVEIKENEKIQAVLTIGKVATHPNSIDHHIQWMSLFFLPDGSDLVKQIGQISFSAHGEAPSSSTYTHHESTFFFNTNKPGRLVAVACCNIHGLWQSQQRLEILE